MHPAGDRAAFAPTGQFPLDLQVESKLYRKFVTDSRRLIQIVLAIVLVLSAGGFAWASHVERAKEGAAVTSLGPEGSPDREAAERAANRTSTTATSPTSTAVSATSVPAATTPKPTISPTTLREGSPAREAAERAKRTSTIPTTTSPVPTTVPAIAPSAGASTPSTTATTLPAATVPTSSNPSRASETLFGFHTESTATTVVGVTLLLAAALAVMLFARRWVFVFVAGIAGLFAALDVHEALHQNNEGRASLVVAAVALAAAHGLAAALGLIEIRPPREPRTPVSATSS